MPKLKTKRKPKASRSKSVGCSTLRAMVLVYEERLTCSIWMDYGGMCDEETGKDLPMSDAEMIADLKQGVRDGRYVGWRLIRLEKEVMGNEE